MQANQINMNVNESGIVCNKGGRRSDCTCMFMDFETLTLGAGLGLIVVADLPQSIVASEYSGLRVYWPQQDEKEYVRGLWPVNTWNWWPFTK